MFRAVINLLKKLRDAVKRFFGLDAKPVTKKDAGPEARQMEMILQKAKVSFQQRWKRNAKSQASLADFEVIKTLGEGKFGRVMLIRKRVAVKPSYYALKIMNKRTILMRCSVTCVLFEKRILQAVNHPFLVNYRYHFKDNANLYLVLEYVSGGDLFTHLRRAVRFGESQTKFYAAQIILSLEYLHYMGVVHRDIKPENIMVDDQGFLKLTDFGFSKFIGNGMTSTKCGTRVYMSPEILAFKRNFYSFYVDWWPVGVLIYEMSVGRVPFEAANNLELIYKINKHEVRYPSYLKGSRKNIVKAMLHPNLERRLITARDIKMEAFFDDVNWIALYERKVKAPFIPTVRSIMDTSNFDNFKEERIEEWQEDVYSEEFKDF